MDDENILSRREALKRIALLAAAGIFAPFAATSATKNESEENLNNNLPQGNLYYSSSGTNKYNSVFDKTITSYYTSNNYYNAYSSYCDYNSIYTKYNSEYSSKKEKTKRYKDNYYNFKYDSRYISYSNSYYSYYIRYSSSYFSLRR
jgi:hypothetical protein